MDHSPAQLRLLVRAASRIEAGRGLVNLHTVYAANAAVQVKEGRQIMERMQKELVRRAEGKADER